MLARSAIEQFLTERPETLVVVDEAYVDFGAESCAPLVASHANLLVTQSLSKSRALAGLRVGLAFGQPGSWRPSSASRTASTPTHWIGWPVRPRWPQ